MSQGTLTRSELSKLTADPPPESYGSTAPAPGLRRRSPPLPPAAPAEDEPGKEDGSSEGEGLLERAVVGALCGFADAPEYNQDNPDILTGQSSPLSPSYC